MSYAPGSPLLVVVVNDQEAGGGPEQAVVVLQPVQTRRGDLLVAINGRLTRAQGVDDDQSGLVPVQFVDKPLPVAHPEPIPDPQPRVLMDSLVLELLLKDLRALISV